MKEVIKNNSLENGYLTNAQYRQVLELYKKERRIVSWGLVVVVVFAVQDFLEDLGEGKDWLMVVTDVLYVSLMIALLVYIWKLAPLAETRRNQLLNTQIDKHFQDAEEWRDQAKKLIDGLGQLISQQFAQWKLSNAEQEVAVMLLKGYSLKEIASMRETGEKTVRQQATRIYAKAGLSGRAELSAFFLEDLLPGREV